MSLDLHFGNAVTGRQRFSRPELENRLVKLLESSAGVKMFGLRRIGKSTLRLYATERFDAVGRPYAYIDAQGLQSLGDLLARLSQALPDSQDLMTRAFKILASGPVKTVLTALSKGEAYEQATLSAHWQLVSGAILKALRGDGPKPVLVIDEFSYLIDNLVKRQDARGRDDADNLLASMREWRGEGMTMLLTGSIGLTGIARKHGLNLEHLNDLKPFAVPELTEDEARDFIGQAVAAVPDGAWSDTHTEAFMQEVSVLYPIFLVAGLLEVGVDTPADPETFAEIFAERVRPDLHDTFLNQFDRRFKDYADLPNGERQKLLLPALKAIMEADAARLQDDIPSEPPFTRIDLNLALEMLAEDGFIHFTETRQGDRLWRPATRLAQLWWKRARLA